MTTDNLGELAERIGQLARVPTLLVACDYDGTLAPFTDNPMEARPNRVSVAALRSLAEQANTQVSIISGRALPAPRTWYADYNRCHGTKKLC